MPNPGTDPTNDQQEESKAPEAGKDEEKKQKPEEKLYTESDLNAKIDEVVKAKRARWEKDQEAKLKAEKDKLTEAQKLEKMNAEEAANYKAEQLQKRIDELEREKSLSEQMTVARKTLKESNIGISDELLSMIVSPDAETTKKAVDAFKELYTKDLNSGVTEALKRNPPKADPQTPGKGKSAGALAAERHNAQFKKPTE